jgi:hypothetical protein
MTKGIAAQMVDTTKSNAKIAYYTVATPFAFCFDLLDYRKKRSKSLRKKHFRN